MRNEERLVTACSLFIPYSIFPIPHSSLLPQLPLRTSMNSRISFVALPAFLALAASATAGDPLAYETQALKDMARLIRQDEAQLRWRDIPWYTDANDGLKAAGVEKRPVFLWVTGDNPLGRC
jgi:hypothetical protein